jgi:hypothetical protein
MNIQRLISDHRSSARIGDIHPCGSLYRRNRPRAGAYRRQARAGTSVQPTPRSMAIVEERMGELSPELVAAVKQGMARAREADGAGDKTACEQALGDVQQTLGK